MRSTKSGKILALSIGLSLTCFGVNDVLSDEVPTDSMQERLRQQAERTRHQFRGAETPDSIMFQSLIRRTSEQYVSDPERTIRNVKYDMRFSSDAEAVAFISILDQHHKNLSKNKLLLRKSILCTSTPYKSRKNLFNDVDLSWDRELSLAAFAYDEFVATLDPDYLERFSTWLEEAKQGYQYYVFKAESSFEGRADDPIAHYRDKCIQMDEKLRAEQ